MPPWLVALMQRLRRGSQAEPTLPGVEAKPPWETHPDPVVEAAVTSGLADTLFTAFGRPMVGQSEFNARGIRGVFEPYFDFDERSRQTMAERGTPPGGALWLTGSNKPREGPVPDRRPLASTFPEDVEWILSHEMGHKAWADGINKSANAGNWMEPFEPFAYVNDLAPGLDPYSKRDPRERWAQTFANAVEAYRVLHSADLDKNRQAMDAMMVDREKKMPGTAYVMQWMSQATDIYSKHPAAGYAAEWATRFDSQYRTLARSK